MKMNGAFQVHEAIKRTMTKLARNKRLPEKARVYCKKQAKIATKKYNDSVLRFWNKF